MMPTCQKVLNTAQVCGETALICLPSSLGKQADFKILTSFHETKKDHLSDSKLQITAKTFLSLIFSCTNKLRFSDLNISLNRTALRKKKKSYNTSTTQKKKKLKVNYNYINTISTIETMSGLVLSWFRHGMNNIPVYRVHIDDLFFFSPLTSPTSAAISSPMKHV